MELAPINTSRRIRAVDFDQKWMHDRARELCCPERIHRKIWEFAAICQVWVGRFGHLRRPVKCLGFGCGKEPIPAWLANRHSKVIVTDAPYDNANWTDTNQRAVNLNELPWLGICRSDLFADNIDFRQVDMNHIPDDLLQGQFDFTWSCGSFEHIGGIDASIAFFCQQMQTLKPGGIAAHTTEFNPIDSDETLDESNLCLFRERDLRRLELALTAQGDRLWPLDLVSGTTEADEIVDVSPYENDVHLSIKVGDWTTTSVLLVAEKGPR